MSPPNKRDDGSSPPLTCYSNLWSLSNRTRWRLGVVHAVAHPIGHGTALRRRWCWDQLARLAPASLSPVVFAPRWFASMWSECSVSCGRGSHSRQVTCRRMKANGTVQVMSSQACPTKDRPLVRKPCSRRPCVRGVTEPGRQVTSCVDSVSLVITLL